MKKEVIIIIIIIIIGISFLLINNKLEVSDANLVYPNESYNNSFEFKIIGDNDLDKINVTIPITQEIAENVVEEILKGENKKITFIDKGLNDSYVNFVNFGKRQTSGTINYKYNENTWVVGYRCIENVQFCSGRVLIDPDKREISIQVAK